MKTKRQLAPHKVRADSHAWWYEEPFGIIVVVEASANARQVRIPWPKLLTAAERCGALRGKKEREDREAHLLRVIEIWKARAKR